MTWLLILVSMFTVSLMLVLASCLGLQYGVGTRDIVTLLLTPFQTLNAESLPTWFTTKSDKVSPSFFSKGFSGNLLLLIWAVMGSLLAMAFMSNIRAMLLKPVYENPIDSTKDIFKAGKIPMNGRDGGYWAEFLKVSANPWERLAFEKGITWVNRDTDHLERLMREEVYSYGTHVVLRNPEAIAHTLNIDDFFKEKPLPIFHASKERIR